MPAHEDQLDLRVDFTTDERQPLEHVAVAPRPDSPFLLPDELRDLVVIDVIHSGNVIPAVFLESRTGAVIPPEAFEDAYLRERDWGAPLLARALAEMLGLPGYNRVTLARTLMDFGRFPGSTPHGASHEERLAINRPFSTLLTHAQKRHLLIDYYDAISDAMEQAIQGRLIKIAVHTYDRYSPHGAERPEFSIITRSQALEREAPGFMDAFDELYPQELGEFTADPVLRDRISLTLQKKGLFVEPNYPYSLPEGSLEVRAEVWSFFYELRAAFLERYPDTRDDPSYQLVWEMLLDTNLRRADAEVLRSYLHRYCRVPPDRVDEFERTRAAYVAIGEFLRGNRHAIIEGYRDSPHRLNALALEVRKDLLWDFDRRGRPLRPHPEEALMFAGAIAEGVVTYLLRDRPTRGT